jgi:hypothetical protein
MNPIAVWQIRTEGDRDAMLVGGVGRPPDDACPTLIREGEHYRLQDLVEGSFVGIYFFGDITREALNLLVEMRQSGWVICAADARTPTWTGIEIPKFRVVGE